MSWVATYTGQVVDLVNPQPESIKIEDIAHALSQICRYTGHTKEFYSVGYHTLLAYDLARKHGHSDRVLLLILMHDFSEYVLGDVSRPLKDLLPEYKVLEEKMMDCIYRAFDVAPPDMWENAIIKYYDNALLACEVYEYMANPELYGVGITDNVEFIKPSDNAVSTGLKSEFEIVLSRYKEKVS